MFAIDYKEFSWEEIESAAKLWGEWDELAQTAMVGLACLKWATATGREINAAEVNGAANEFRYSRKLISADEATAWLQGWGLSVDDWMNYFRRVWLRDNCSNLVDAIVREYPQDSDEVTSIIKTEALCSGKLGEWAHRLAGRAAVSAKCEQRLDTVAEIDSSFESCCERFLTDSKRRDSIANHCLDWVRFECRYIWFAEERLAREAALCVNEDGFTLDDVAGDSRSVVQDWQFFLDELEPGARGDFLAAKPGQWLGPLKLLEGFPLFSVVKKTLPTDNDPEIRRRAEEAILNNVIAQEMTNRVKWMAQF